MEHEREVIRRAQRELGPRVPRVELPRDLRPDLYLFSAPSRRPIRSPEEHMRAYVSGEEIFGQMATLDEVQELVRPIPHGWLVWMCSVLEHFMHRDQPYSVHRQQQLVEELLPEDLRALVRPRVAERQIFVHEEQLLAVARLAIEHAADEERDATPDERSRFGQLLLQANDLIGAEGPGEDGGREELTAFGLRSLAFQTSQIFWHLIARGYAYWWRIPPLLQRSPKYHDIRALFEAAADAPVDAYFTAAVAAFVHSQHVVSGADSGRWKAWTFDPKTLIAAPQDPAGLERAWRALSADRAQLRALFAARPPAPLYAGVAMVPFRQRPIFRFASGNMVVLSTRYLLEGLTSGVFWRIADHIRADDRARRRFTDFVGETHERYVLELVRSAYDWDAEHRRVCGDADARPEDARETPASADALAFLGDHHVFVETTITGFRYDKTILPADLLSFDEDMRRSVVAKARQLEQAIEDYRVRRMRYGEFSTPALRDRTIWPVVVLRDPLPTFFLLKDRIDGLLRDGGVGRVDPPVHLLSTEELELALRRLDDDRLRRLLSDWRNDASYRTESFRNFYLERHGDERGPVPYLKESYDAAFDLVRRQMGFPEQRALSDQGPAEAASPPQHEARPGGANGMSQST